MPESGAISEAGDEGSMGFLSRFYFLLSLCVQWPFYFLWTWVVYLFRFRFVSRNTPADFNEEREAQCAAREAQCAAREARCAELEERPAAERRPGSSEQSTVHRSMSANFIFCVSEKIAGLASDAGAVVRERVGEWEATVPLSPECANLISVDGKIVLFMKLLEKATDVAGATTEKIYMVPLMVSGRWLSNKVGRSRLAVSAFEASSCGDAMLAAAAGSKVVKDAVKEEGRKLQNVLAESTGKVVRCKFGEGAGQAATVAVSTIAKMAKTMYKTQKSASWRAYVPNPFSLIKAAAYGASESRAPAET